jgi:hypothetical protein
MKTSGSVGDRVRALLVGIVDRFSVCSHRRTTLPRSHWVDATADTQRGSTGEMYVVCLDCGRTLPYDWKKMRRGKQRDLRDEPTPGAPGGG